MSSGDKTTLLPSLGEAEMFAALVHELALELLHKVSRRAATTPKIRQTEAEAVAFIVSSAVVLDVNSASSDYIALYNGDKATLLDSLARVQQTASEILAAIMSADAFAQAAAG